MPSDVSTIQVRKPPSVSMQKVGASNIDLREVNHNPLTIVGYLQPTLEKAKQLADKEILSHGHVCSAACKAWKGVSCCASQLSGRSLLLSAVFRRRDPAVRGEVSEVLW